MDADKTVFEPKPPRDPDSPLSFSMEGIQAGAPPPLIPRFWAPGWNSPQAMNKFQTEVGGPLRGGDPGIRLIEPGEIPELFEQLPKTESRPDGKWCIVALAHIFGSEELSVHAPAIAQLVPKPYLGIRPDDAAKLGKAERDSVKLRLKESELLLPLRFLPLLPPGTVGLPSGLPGLGFFSLPAWGDLS